jgi:hypothetical protein
MRVHVGSGGGVQTSPTNEFGAKHLQVAPLHTPGEGHDAAVHIGGDVHASLMTTFGAGHMQRSSTQRPGSAQFV